MTIDYGMIVQSMLAGRLALSGQASTGLVPADADPAAFLQALLQQFQGKFPALPEGKATTGQGADSSRSGNAADKGGKALPDAKELMDQLEQQGLTPEQLAQLLTQFAAQANAAPAPVKGGSAGTPEVPAAGLAALGTIPASEPSAVPRMAVAAGLNHLAAAPTGVEASRSMDGKVGSISPLLNAAPVDAPQSASDDAKFSTVLQEVDAEAPSGLSYTPQVPPDAKSIGELAGAQHQPTVEPAQEQGLALEKPVGHPDWSQDLGERVLWMSGRGLQAAELRLDPPHLGPLEVRIDLTQDQTSIQFVSHHAAVREAIESAIPKLREMLGAQQLNLTEVNVSQQSFTEQRSQGNAQFAFDQQPRPQGEGFKGQIAEVPSAYPESEPLVSRTGRGLLSLYA